MVLVIYIKVEHVFGWLASKQFIMQISSLVLERLNERKERENWVSLLALKPWQQTTISPESKRKEEN